MKPSDQHPQPDDSLFETHSLIVRGKPPYEALMMLIPPLPGFEEQPHLLVVRFKGQDWHREGSEEELVQLRDQLAAKAPVGFREDIQPLFKRGER